MTDLIFHADDRFHPALIQCFRHRQQVGLLLGGETSRQDHHLWFRVQYRQ